MYRLLQADEVTQITPHDRLRPMVRIALLLVASHLGFAADWPAFRGPNSAGVSDSASLPVEFGPSKNMVWKTALPAGHSSPVIVGNRIWVTGFDETRLFVIALDRDTGRVAWRREIERPRKQELHKSNSPASPSVATDGKNVYAFFTDFGLVSYGSDGEERWRLPLGPFNNPFGMGASPLYVDGKILQNCDSETGSFLIAVDAKTGKQVWRVERPDFTRGFSTPVLWRSQVLIPGTNRLIAYDPRTGKEIWWIRGLTWQLKPTPAVDGDTAYVLGWAGGADQGNQESLPEFTEVLKTLDKDGDRRLTPAEVVEPRMQKDFKEADLDLDGYLGARDWEKYRGKRASVNSVMAVKLGGDGDMTDKSILWQHYKSLPNVPSPVFYKGVVYLMKEGGILTALDAASGKVVKQGRLPGALDYYYASPVAGDGKLYVTSQEGHISVIRAGADWEVLTRNDMDDETFATPALLDGKVYVRTRSALYCFGAPAQ
ncbi:MAG TPA: PQQ-binding-like beta-propeller repeat protein [Bryobacteraceae bacterium]|nr:PQQ-binding-like beta-propeller repeat protein [Bryobacteraceae bacterium]